MNEKRNSKRQKSFKMPGTDFNDAQNLDDEILFPVEEIAQYPLPGYVSPTSISFSPDDSLISYLFSPDNTLNRNIFTYDLKSNKQELLFSPPDGGLDESNISPDEKLRRERLRERGLGVTRYEWVKTNSKRKAVMVPLPAGIYFHDISLSKTELKLPSIPASPTIDPHLSPDGSKLAYVRDFELHVMNLLSNESKQLTHGAKENGFIHGLAEYIAQEEMDRKTGYWWSLQSLIDVMACNGGGGGGGCQSGCYKDEETTRDQPTASSETDSGSSSNLCLKCKLNVVVSGYGGIDDGRFCADCFRSNLFGKFRLAVTSNAMISPTDKVLVAFSGGPSSRVALQFVHDMQERAHKNFEASRDRSLPVFGVGVVFIDESVVFPIPSREMEEAVEAVSLIVSSLAPPRKEFHFVPIEIVYSSDSSDGKERLIELMNVVSDPTGREDMLLSLRMLALQKVASEFGYNRIVLGSCVSRIAAHVISATVKGQGYSLPADIQYVDARWEIPVVLPLRDCFVQEINMFCRLDSLKTIKMSTGPSSSINSLVSSFVALLQEENPSRESTIVRTAGKLIPFQFNRIPEIIDGNVPLATRRRQKRYNLKSNESVSSESFCPLCNSPLDKSEIVDWSNHKNCRSSDTFYTSCCSSCQFQILPPDSTPMEKFYMDLPHSVVARSNKVNNVKLNALREQIQDCLLSDGEDET